jgi:hypothetical protein
MKYRAYIFTIIFVISILFYKSAPATVYFYWDAESHPCDGSELPNPPIWTEIASYRGHVICGPTPQGNRFLEFQTQANQISAYTEIHNTQGLPINNVLGKTYYLAYFFKFTRINGLDIWHESSSSADKGVELTGNGIRQYISRGYWNGAYNLDHHYTVWGGGYHLNPAIEVNEIYVANQSGYNMNNQIQLEYERWYSAVMALKIAYDNTGSYTAWINGIKYVEYKNIKTCQNSAPTIEQIKMNGTIAQPAYDAPAHKRQFDALMLTDNWQDVVNGGYLSGSTTTTIADTTPPIPPSGLRITE